MRKQRVNGVDLHDREAAAGKKGEVLERLMALAEPGEGDVAAQIGTAIRPGPDRNGRAAVAGAVRGGRDRLEAMFRECLVADQLDAILGRTDEKRARIGALLNTPFPERKEITLEFLDLLVSRIQRLEEFVRLLAAVLVEAQYPSDRSPVNSVSASSAGRRRF